jgi:hypothetical protein
MGRVVMEDIWTVVRLTPQIDPMTLARAVEVVLKAGPMDYRTRLLVRDSVGALRGHWGEARFRPWIEGIGNRERLDEACRTGDADEVGFPSLARRLMDAVTPEMISKFLRELATHVTKPTRLVVGGSAALILRGYFSRHTEDVDVVDEVPAELRGRHDALEQLVDRYGLRLTHFQSHYLNEGWEKRVESAGVFGNLHVFLVDVYDVFVGKLFSARLKDRDDLRALEPQLDRETITRRVRETAGTLRADARLAGAAAENWFIVFGETLPE